MGRHLVDLLSEQNIETVVTSRKPIAPKGSVRYVEGNAQNPHFLASLLGQKWDAIIDFMVYRTTDFKLRLQALLSCTSQYVYLSSARVYAGCSGPITEQSPRFLDASPDTEYLQTDEYALAKARQENMLLNSGRSNWTIIRPYITYAENRLQLGVLEKEEWLYRALQGRTILFSRDISQRYTTMTYGGDVARAIAALIGKNDTLGQVFHVTSDKAILWQDVLYVYLDVLESHLGKRPRVILQDLGTFMHWKRATYQIKYDRLYDRTFDNSKIARHLDITSFKEVRAELALCLERFVEKPEFLYINWKTEAIKDRQTGELAAWREIPGFKRKLIYSKNRYM